MHGDEGLRPAEGPSTGLARGSHGRCRWGFLDIGRCCRRTGESTGMDGSMVQVLHFTRTRLADWLGKPPRPTFDGVVGLAAWMREGVRVILLYPLGRTLDDFKMCARD